MQTGMAALQIAFGNPKTALPSPIRSWVTNPIIGNAGVTQEAANS
jgi:hypothetical protein